MWKIKNHKGEEVKWYSEEEYKRLLMKIVELKKTTQKNESEGKSDNT